MAFPPNSASTPFISCWPFASADCPPPLDAAFAAIQLQSVNFTGGLFWDDNGVLVRNPLPSGGPEWVGPPNQATDRLWERVSDAAGVILPARDANMVKGLTKQLPDGRYVTGLDVFHQLHCLVSTPAFPHRPRTD